MSGLAGISMSRYEAMRKKDILVVGPRFAGDNTFEGDFVDHESLLLVVFK